MAKGISARGLGLSDMVVGERRFIPDGIGPDRVAPTSVKNLNAYHRGKAKWSSRAGRDDLGHFGTWVTRVS